MLTDITAARDAALADIEGADTLDDIAVLTARLLGKKGDLAQLKSGLGRLESIDDKKAAGQAINDAMSAVSSALDHRRGALATEALAGSRRCRTARPDRVRRQARRGAMLTSSRRHGSVWKTSSSDSASRSPRGPEVETDWHNFEALNMGEGHPARGEFDTLFVDHVTPDGKAGTTLLRTHTSPVQIRTMLESEPPIYIVAPGRVFRRDTPDATHMPVFHQIEGLVIDRDITMADLAGTIEAFTKAFFGSGFTSRLRPSYFPFTEPSAEFDIQRPDGSWIELGGCGMVHPNVLRAGGLDPEEWSGFAFGFGIDRMAKERHGVEDIRDMYTNDIRFLEQFS